MNTRFTILLVCVLLSCTQLPALAQQRFSVGPRVGVNFAKFNGDGGANSFRPGLAVGAFVMYSSLNQFGLSADVLYSQRGGKFTNILNATPTEDLNQRVNYLEIPIAFRYFLTRDGSFRPNLFAGPSVGIKLDAKGEVYQGGTLATSADNSASFRPLDLGLMAGFQLNFPGLGERQRFLVDARYTYGLTNIALTPVGGNNISNSTITVTLGYGFGVGPEFRSRSKSAPARRR